VFWEVEATAKVLGATSLPSVDAKVASRRFRAEATSIFRTPCITSSGIWFALTSSKRWTSGGGIRYSLVGRRLANVGD
jgi:hypothetical protein